MSTTQAPVTTLETDPPPRKKAFSASSGMMHKWAIGGIADYWMYSQFAAISLIFTTTYKLDPRIVGIALFFPRVVDGFLDPIVGHLSDNLHTSWGRRRPFLLITAIIGAILVTALWWTSVDWPRWLQLVCLTVGAVLLFSTWGTYTMAHSALGYELSDDYNDRSRVFAIKGVYFSFMSIGGGYFWSAAMTLGHGANWATPFGFNLKIPSVGGEINALRILAACIAVMIVASACVTVYFCRERFANANRKHVDLRKACIATLHCRPFVVLLVLQLARTLGTSLYGTLAAYIGIYYVCGGNKEEFAAASIGLGGVAGFVFSLFMWPLAKPLTKGIGKRWGLILTFGLSFVYAVMLPFITIPGKIWLLVFSGFAFIFPMAVQNLFLTSIMPDICDLDELQNGERREGLFSAVKSFVDKIEISLCTLLGMWLLSYIGFNAKLPQQPQEVMTRMLWWAFTPKIIFSAVALVICFYMPITEKLMAQVRKELDARHAAAGVPGASGTPPAA